MTKEKAIFLAVNKLKWQVENGYRECYTDADVTREADTIFYLSNAYKGGE